MMRIKAEEELDVLVSWLVIPDWLIIRRYLTYRGSIGE